MSEMRRHPNVVNVSEIEPHRLEKGTRFGLAMRRLGLTAGGSAIGCSWYEVPPGRTAFPYHFHCMNEEALYILEGEGTMRIGEASVAVRQGDYIAFPVGPGSAHQLINSGAAPLRYLCLSTMNKAELCGYPDSGKVGVMAAPAPGEPHWVIGMFRKEATVDYYEGEELENLKR